MKQTFSDWLAKALAAWIGRFGALLDGSAWLMIAPAFVWLYFKDAPLVLSVLQWSAYLAVMAGLAVMISRVAFPHLDLSAFLKDAKAGSVAAAIVAAAVIVFVAWTVQSLAGWARPILPQ